MVAKRTLIADPVRLREEVARIKSQPLQFIRRLKIEGLAKNGRIKLMPIAQLWPEQIPWLLALLTSRLVLGIKPRQVGYSTITIAYFLWKVLTSPDPRLVLQMVHEDGALKRFAKMLRVFHRELPDEIRDSIPVKPNNQEETLYLHNGGGFNRLLAGGGGQGRSWTYSDIHATEMSKWRVGTSASPSDKGDKVVAADEEVWSSAVDTVHDSDGQIVVESTGNGARGLFYSMHETAVRDPAWKVVFVPWFKVQRYRIPLGDPEAKALDEDLDRPERKLMEDYQLDLEQIAWRRWKLKTMRATELHFRREFPCTPAEAFLMSESGWFDQEALSVQLHYAWDLGANTEHLQIFEPFEEGHRYTMSIDPGGGTGRDESSIYIGRDDLVQVATWNHDRAGPEETAQMASKLGGMFGSPLTIIEENGRYGPIVEKKLRRLGGVRLFRDIEHDRADQNFYSTNATKREMFVHAREVIDAGLLVIRDSETIRQLLRIVEKPNGKIEGSGRTHDDRALACVLNLWAARRFWRRDDDGLREKKRRVSRIIRWGEDASR